MVASALQLFLSLSLLLVTGTAYDEVSPTWVFSPTVTNLKPRTFDLKLSMDTTGYAYAVVVAGGATAPTAAEVKALTASGGSQPLAKGLVLVGTSNTDVLLPVSTIKTASKYTGVNTYSVYVVAEDDNRCPPCKNPAVGCFEYCKCNGCNSGECECRNIQDTVTSLSVTMPFPWQKTPVGYDGGALGVGYPEEWPTDSEGPWTDPISFSVLKLDHEDAPYRIKGGGAERHRRALLQHFSNSSDGAPAIAGDAAAEEAEAERIIAARRQLLERREKPGHMLTQWKVTVSFAQGVNDYNFNDGELLGCFISNFEVTDEKTYVVQLTACDPCGSQHANGKLEGWTGSPIKYKSCTRTNPGQDGGGKCQFRIPSGAYEFNSPVNVCPVNYDTVGQEIDGGASNCAYTIPTKASPLLSLEYTEFVGACPMQYREAHKNATSVIDLDATLETFVNSFNNITLPI